MIAEKSHDEAAAASGKQTSSVGGRAFVSSIPSFSRITDITGLLHLQHTDDLYRAIVPRFVWHTHISYHYSMSLLNVAKRAFTRPISSTVSVAVGIALVSVYWAYSSGTDTINTQPVVARNMHIHSIPMCKCFDPS